MVKYVYDACGNQKVQNPDGSINTNPDFIGNINPFRYRGYYFDTETGLYFLNTRYYDPTIGRFINADDISYLDPESINGLNLYAYCLNNPIMYYDPTGHFLIALILGGLALIGAAVGGKIAHDKGVAAGKTGADLFWSTVGGVVLGFGVGLAVGGAVVAFGAVVAGALAKFGIGAGTFLGLAAPKVFVIGALAWNVTALVIMPMYGIPMQAIDYQPKPTKVPKPGETPKHPSNRKSALLPISFLKMYKSLLNKYFIN